MENKGGEDTWRYFVVFVVTFACCKAQTCAPSECGEPPTNDNTGYKPEQSCYTVGEQIEYTCEGDLGGPPYNLCSEGGTWRLPPPVCEVFTCQAPAVASNVDLSPNQTVYDARVSVNYSCGDTAELVGPSSANCDSQDTWSPPTIPVCVAICSVPAVDNGQVSPDDVAFKDGDSAFVSCNDGYTIESGESSTMVCQSNGTWDQIPTCYDIDECDDIPCGGNGECLNFDGGYNCTCTPQWQGSNCETDVNECDASPCQNGGACINFDGGYECVCQSGWQGVNCETDINECLQVPCENNGVCFNFDGGYNCTCQSEWQGANCEIDVNECESSPCLNNGVCNNYGGGYNCTCQAGWQDKNCQTDKNECLFTPCLNNGVCYNFEGGYNCTCGSGWQGDNCEIDLNECESSPCLNNGVCNNYGGGYNCTCQAGWQDKNCQTDKNECEFTPCLNGGFCYNYEGGYNCTCESGWKGDNCEIDFDECAGNPCQNGAVCYNYNGGYNCSCQQGWQGDNCETDVNECDVNPCLNKGVCINYDGDYNCTCDAGWQDKNCQTDKNECLFTPCLNNGVCYNFEGGYNCTCEGGWQGDNCEIDVNECDVNPCLNNGVCNNYEGGYNCTCQTGWKGRNCETDINECVFSPCQNGGLCNNYDGGYNCTCLEGWQGVNCEGEITGTCFVPPIDNSNTENGMNVTYGETYVIRCDQGYSYNQRTQFPVSCSYGDLVPTDVIPETCYRNCPRRNPPLHGNVTAGVRHGVVIEYLCDPGYILEGPPSSTCNDGQWEPRQPPTCNAICPPPAIPNARVTPTNVTFTEGNAAHVTCDAGYTLGRGSSTILCQGNGTWDQLPTCLAYCMVPPVENSNSEEGLNISHGEVFTIRCDGGYSYDMRTIFEVSCLNGDLVPMDVIPEACYKSCTVPPVENSNTDDGERLNHGESYNIRCNNGYSFNQRSNFLISCMDGELVSPSMVPVTCHQDCRSREAPHNGGVTVGKRHGKTVNYSCEQGFLLIGPSTTTCIDGHWEPEETPTCQAICPVPIVANGHVTPLDGVFLEGDSAFVTCDAGYTLEPPSPLTCQSDGSWDQIPFCLGYCTVPPVDNSNSQYGLNISHGEHYVIQCDRGFSYNQRRDFNVSCSNGDLIPMDVIPEACYRDCRPKQGPENGDVTPGRRHGETVEYSCNQGFHLTGPSSSTCNDGLWDPLQMPTCETICPVPVIDNGELTPVNVTFKEGDRANVSCHTGFSLAGGSPSVVCQPDGTWSPFPSCLETCEIPPVPNSNTTSGVSLTHGVSYTIVCDQGFTYDQEVSFEVDCLDGELTPVTVLPETCYRNCPERLVGPPNGVVTDGSRHGETVYYSCLTGYSLDGPSSAKCIDGQWDPFRQPSCSIICPTPNVENAKLIPSNVTFTEGDTAVVSCDEGFYLQDEDSPYMVCLSNGHWDNIPRCIELCFILAIPNSNFEAGGSLKSGDTAIIRCNRGFSFGQETVFRVTCSDGELVSRTSIPDACYRDCSPRIPPENGQVSPEYEFKHGVTVEYSCIPGFEIRGPFQPTSATCNDGRWEPMRYPICVEESFSEDGLSLHCLENVFRVVIPGKLLVNQTESVHLNDNNCVGRRQLSGDVIVESQYNSCGTMQEVDDENKKIVYKNTVSDVLASHSSSAASSIHVNIDVVCLFDQDKLVSTNYALESSLRQSLSQTGEYDVSFSLYTDDTFSEVQQTPVFIDDSKNIFLKVQLETEVSGLSLLVTRCWATPTDSADDSSFINLIENGCPAQDYDVQISPNLDSTSKPSFAFSTPQLQFAQSNVVYVHCNIRICEASLFGDCRPFCSGFPRSKRNSGLMISRRFSQGPIIKDMSTQSGDASWSLPAVVTLSVFSVLFVCGLVFVSVKLVNRRNTVKATAKDDIY